MIATMLLFLYQGHDVPTHKDLVLAWLPLVLVDVAIVEYLLGLLLWYGSKNTKWRFAVMGVEVASQLVGTIVIAFWMYSRMSLAGGLGKDEAALGRDGTPRIKTEEERGRERQR